jgi:hypothetical protein
MTIAGPKQMVKPIGIAMKFQNVSIICCEHALPAAKRKADLSNQTITFACAGCWGYALWQGRFVPRHKTDVSSCITGF